MNFKDLYDFERSLYWLVQEYAPSADFLAYIDFKHLQRRIGYFSFALEYWDGSVLFAEAQVKLLHGKVSLSSYRFQYQLESQTILRYDDAPHFPKHSTFPNHKHIGENEKAYPCYAPLLEEVLKEIEEIIAGGTVIIPLIL